jgi:hypothetical protein
MNTLADTLAHDFGGDANGDVCVLCNVQRWQDCPPVCAALVAVASVDLRVAYFKGLSIFEMATIANCAQPDAADGAGAELFINIQFALLDWIAFEDGKPVPVSELADGAQEVYTHKIWLQFIDLCGYNEELALEMALGSTMTQQAQYVLGSIAERFIYNICNLLGFVTDSD